MLADLHLKALAGQYPILAPPAAPVTFAALAARFLEQHPGGVIRTPIIPPYRTLISPPFELRRMAPGGDDARACEFA